MKTYLPQILMGLVILFGIGLTVTPFVAENFFPASEAEVRQAKSRDVVQALKTIFQSPDGDISDARAIHKKTADSKTAWFSFRSVRKPVQSFIHARKLEQKELSEEILNQAFFKNAPPVSWWQPDLGTETYFTGEDNMNKLHLIYNSRTKRGVLVISTSLNNK